MRAPASFPQTLAVGGAALAVVALALSSVSAGCGGARVAPTPAGSVMLRFRPPSGARYGARLGVDVIVPRGGGARLRTTSRLSLEVVGVANGVTTLRARVLGERLELPDNPVRLPPSVTASTSETEARVDERGRLLGTPRVISGTPSPALGSYLSGAHALPSGAVRVGESWQLPSSFAWQGEHFVRGTREGSARLDEVAGGRAHVSSTTRTHFAPSDYHGISVRGELEIRGSTWISLADGLARSGGGHAIVSWPGAPEDLTRYLPASVDVSWCAAREDEEACAPDVEAPDTRPVARAFEGDECASRVSALRSALAALPPPSEPMLPGAQLVVVDHGTEASATLLPRVEIAGDGTLGLDGRAMRDVSTALSDLDTLRRNWGLLHSGVAYPARVQLVVDPAAPLSAVVPVIDALGRTLTVEILVDTGRRHDVPSGPAWVSGAITSSDPPERATQLARAFETATAGCAPLIVMLGAIANAPIEDRDRILRAEAPAAVAQCRCGGVDVDALEALLVRMNRGTGVELGVLVLPRGGAGRELRLRRAGTFADLVRALADRAPPGSAAHVRLR